MASLAPCFSLLSVLGMVIIVSSDSDMQPSFEETATGVHQMKTSTLGSSVVDGATFGIETINKGGSGCTSSAKCAAGEGDCDSDDHCMSGLECLQRIGNEKIPGFTTGDMPSGYDVCYDPDPDAPETINKGGSGCTSSAKCAAGEGDCDSDDHCMSGLKCLQRIGNEQIPGFTTGDMPSGYDVCYDPSATWKNRDCDAHIGLEATWAAPYRKLKLDDELESLGCNPASCRNDPGCGIPDCKGTLIKWESPYKNLADRDFCPGSGCSYVSQINTKVNALTYSSPILGSGMFQMRLGGTREGGFADMAGNVVHCFPSCTGFRKSRFSGAYLYPDAKNCNPLGLLVCSKKTVTHSGMYRGDIDDDELEKTAAVFTKTSWCINVDDDDRSTCLENNPNHLEQCPTQKCYSSKYGRCVRFNEKVWNNDDTKSYNSDLETHDMHASAIRQMDQNEYSDCPSYAQESVALVIAGN